ncbi:MAG: ABC transporter substrate binding protein [Pseudolabrys sp.]|jgi:putative ABC transport system substrate-binding protein
MERVRAERRADDLWANSSKIFRRLAVYVDKIVAGARPNEFPIEQPTRFELVINLKTAKSIGLTVPPSVLARADEVGKPDVKASETKAGLGTSLIQALAKQLDARVDIASDCRGTAVSMTHATFKAKPSQAMKLDFVPANEISERVQ